MEQCVVVLLFVSVIAAAGEVIVASPVTKGSEKHTVYLDSDHDGIPDYLDACPGRMNTGLADSDGDLLIDECDLDPLGSGRPRPLQTQANKPARVVLQ